jgi:hypothetical protein
MYLLSRWRDEPIMSASRSNSKCLDKWIWLLSLILTALWSELLIKYYQVLKARGMGWVGHVARMGRREVHTVV